MSPAGSLFWSVEGLGAGSYLVYAGTDRNGDGYIGDADDLFGAWPDPFSPQEIPLGAADSRSGLDIALLGGSSAAAVTHPRVHRLR